MKTKLLSHSKKLQQKEKVTNNSLCMSAFNVYIIQTITLLNQLKAQKPHQTIPLKRITPTIYK